ncbi:MAG: hypothetical protein PHR34_07900 [Kiritimatiellae bacterium]|jgi:hypothetical protein|nr:hypothetical protein [Kiritimatiellia bacterium]
MALSTYQVEVLRLLAARRKAGGESYVAGGVALNQALQASRRSRDIDLFHDTAEALIASWTADREALRAAGYDVAVLREAPSFVEALVALNSERILIQWTRDSAYRFFPLVEDELLGLTLHPLDLATNKVLALVGRMEPRDWMDVLECHVRLQPLGYLIWAAAGKDPGYTPDFLAEEASRHHASQAELDLLDVDGPAPDAAQLSRQWKSAVAQAREILAPLPASRLGTCVLNADGSPCVVPPAQLPDNLASNQILFHPGRIGGAWPMLKPSP